jgi:hypothetical protein
MAFRFGAAETPEDRGLRLTVEAPTGTSSTAPTVIGRVYKLAGTDTDGGGHKIAALATDDDPTSCVFVEAAERVDSVRPMTVFVIGPYSQVRTFDYVDGAAPTIGQGIAATDPTGNAGADAGKVKGQAFQGDSYVLYDDTANLRVEVLC